MLNVTELRPGTVYKESNDLLQVITYEHIKMGRGSGNIKVKVKNLKTGSVTEKSFITGARVEEALVEKRKVQYLYTADSEYFFMDPQSFEQFPLAEEVVLDEAKYFKDGLEASLIAVDDKPIALELPNSLIYQVSQTGPEEKGNSVSNVYKEAILDNGLTVKVPMFIKAGNKVKVDTRSGQYLERVK